MTQRAYLIIDNSVGGRGNFNPCLASKSPPIVDKSQNAVRIDRWHV